MRRPVIVSKAPEAPRDLLEQLAEELSDRLDLRTCRFERFPFDSLLPRIERRGIVLPTAEPGARPYAVWQPSDGVELPVRYGSLTLGRFVLVPHAPTCGVAIPPARRTDAIALADLAGAELQRRWTGTDDLARER